MARQRDPALPNALHHWLCMMYNNNHANVSPWLPAVTYMSMLRVWDYVAVRQTWVRPSAPMDSVALGQRSAYLSLGLLS